MNNLTLILTSISLLGACAAQAPKDDSDDFSDLADAKADAFSTKLKIVDSLTYGQETASAHYTKTPKYRAYTFSAEGGDSIDVWVRSSNGDPMTWVLDSKFKILAKNDDASDTDTNSHIDFTLPASTDTGLPAPAVYYVVYRNATTDSADFTVKLTGGPGYDESCEVDADCAIVSDGGCCPHGVKYVVNSSSTDEWDVLSECHENIGPVCPLFMIDDTRVKSCDSTLHLCQLN